MARMMIRGALIRLAQLVDLRDCFVFGGIAAAAYGIGQIYQPLAYIFSGLSLLWIGIRQ
jgi:hypothetical protein